MATVVGNQLLILLISFVRTINGTNHRWESVTNPLDKLFRVDVRFATPLGISY